jgi:hypothetical protein
MKLRGLSQPKTNLVRDGNDYVFREYHNILIGGRITSLI